VNGSRPGLLLCKERNARCFSFGRAFIIFIKESSTFDEVIWEIVKRGVSLIRHVPWSIFRVATRPFPFAGIEVKTKRSALMTSSLSCSFGCSICSMEGVILIPRLGSKRVY